MKLSPFPPTISCCNRPERRNGFGIPNFCQIRTGHPDFQGPIVLTSQAFVPLVSLKVSAHCVTDVSPRSFLSNVAKRSSELFE